MVILNAVVLSLIVEFVRFFFCTVRFSFRYSRFPSQFKYMYIRLSCNSKLTKDGSFPCFPLHLPCNRTPTLSSVYPPSHTGAKNWLGCMYQENTVQHFAINRVP